MNGWKFTWKNILNARGRYLILIAVSACLFAALLVAAGALTAALQKMAGHNTAGQIIPIVCSPAELILQGSQEQCTVSSTSGNDDISAVSQAGDASRSVP